MKLFYKATAKEILRSRNKIVLERGLPMLYKNGFRRSPFSTAWFGRNNLGSFTYELCKLTHTSILIMVRIHCIKGDTYVQTFINMFQLTKQIEDLSQLEGVDGMHFHLPPNSLTNMRLHVDDFKGVPLLNYDFMFRQHKLSSYLTKRGFERSEKKLGNRIEKDLANINKYLVRWHKLHKPVSVTNEGKVERLATMTVSERLDAFNLTEKFGRARIADREYAIKILKWLEVDDTLIKKALDPNSAYDYR
jgi:hypothetical protein